LPAQAPKGCVRCGFCDRVKMVELCLEKKSSGMSVRALRSFTHEIQNKAMEYIPEEHRQRFRSQLSTSAGSASPVAKVPAARHSARKRRARSASPAPKAPAASPNTRRRVRDDDLEFGADEKMREPAGPSASCVLTVDDEGEKSEEESEEEASEEEEVEVDEDAVYEEWDKDHLEGAVEILDAAVTASVNSKIPLNITELRLLVDGIPNSVLHLADLEGLPETLRKMKNMPKHEKAVDLLVVMQSLATAAVERQRQTASALAAASKVSAATAVVDGGDGKLLIRRLTSLGSISDKDPIDSVDVSKEDTILDVLERVFATLGLEGALADFTFRRVELVKEEDEVTKAKMIPVEGTCRAIEAKEIVLCRKGG